MKDNYKTSVSEHGKPKRRRWGGIPQLAAQLSGWPDDPNGIKPGSIYKVLYGNHKSKRAEHFIALAKEQLGIEMEDHAEDAA
jgi:hypothetical protein